MGPIPEYQDSDSETKLAKCRLPRSKGVSSRLSGKRIMTLVSFLVLSEFMWDNIAVGCMVVTVLPPQVPYGCIPYMGVPRQDVPSMYRRVHHVRRRVMRIQ